MERVSEVLGGVRRKKRPIQLIQATKSGV